jgi:hypothetical protein|tara:strand:+ start:1176 stop:2099 length:924 start_codon:yes stop_codon:yes gene_type:complete
MVKVKLKSGHEIYLDGQLVPVLDTLVYNLPNDWDFVILITGDRMVRTGKSVCAMSICAYLADKLGTKYDTDNVFFDSQSMMDAAQKLPKNSVIQYDEAREGLAAIKTMKTVQQDLIDFFNECGQLNHIFVLVMPDFFSMKEEIAVGRSEMLINVYRKNVKVMRRMYKEDLERPVIRFDRGFFELFNRTKKKTLYDISRATRKKSYQLIKANINGRFTNYYPLDREIYISKKKAALARFAERKDKEKEVETNEFRNKWISFMMKDHTAKQTQEEMSKWSKPLGERRIQEISLENKRNERSNAQLPIIT